MIESLEKLFLLKGLDATTLKHLDLNTKNTLLNALEPINLPNSKFGFQKGFSRNLLERLNKEGFDATAKHRFDATLVAEYLQALHLVETEIKTERGSAAMNMVLCQAGQSEDIVIDQPFLISATKITVAMAYLVEDGVFINYDTGENRLWTPNLNPTDLHNLRQCTVPAHMTIHQAKHFCNHLSELHGFVPYYKYVRSRDSFDEIEGSDGYYVIDNELKWEYAAFANTDQKYAGTDEMPTYSTDETFSVWSKGVTNPPTSKRVTSINSDFSVIQVNKTDRIGVTNKKPNAWGLYDMLGLVPEMIDSYGYFERYDEIYPILKGGKCFINSNVPRSNDDDFSIQTNQFNFGNAMSGSFRVARNPFASIPIKAKTKPKKKASVE